MVTALYTADGNLAMIAGSIHVDTGCVGRVGHATKDLQPVLKAGHPVSYSSIVVHCMGVLGFLSLPFFLFPRVLYTYIRQVYTLYMNPLAVPLSCACIYYNMCIHEGVACTLNSTQ